MKKNKKIKGILALAIIIVLVFTLCFPAYAAEAPIGELDFLNLIPAELLIIAVAVYCIAEFVKRTEKVPSWSIPIFVLVLAIILTVMYSAVVLDQGLTSKTIVNGVIYGILIASIAVYCNQVFKQIFVKRLE